LHTYAVAGNYTACLTAINSCGVDSSCATISTCNLPLTDFNENVNGLQVNFTDNTTNSPTSWLWDFGDGNTSTQQNPSHTYAVAGNYTACLTTINSCGADSSCATISTCNLPLAGFNENVNGRQHF